MAKRWGWAGQQFKGGTVTYQNLTCIVGTELAYTTDVETFEYEVPRAVSVAIHGLTPLRRMMQRSSHAATKCSATINRRYGT